MHLTNQIKLLDQRYLGYAEYGNPEGFPVLFFHGFPGSRLEAQKLHVAALDLNIRLLGLDRPGMGISCSKKNRSLLDWADDIKEFTTHLSIKKFSIIGHSGGAPYIAACAFRIPNLIHQAVIVSGIAPLEHKEAKASISFAQKLMLWISRYFPALLRGMLKLSCKSLENPNRLKKMLKQLPAVDAILFENIQYRDMMIASLKEAFRKNAYGVVEDFKLISGPFGFDLKQVQCPLIIWQGGQDTQAPKQHAEIYAGHVYQADYHFLENEGHISILHNYSKEILNSAITTKINQEINKGLSQMHLLESLNQSLKTAKQRIEVGATYYHYRAPTQLYKVLTLALDEATDKPCVVYQALYGEQLIWVRNLDVWCEKVEHEGQIVSRFIKQI